jgi:hypothetical protein
MTRRGLARRGAPWALGACLLACAPSQGFRPAGMLDAERPRELGVAFSSVEARPYVDETSQYVGQVWWALRLDERWALTTLAAFDSSAAAAGAALRYEVASGQRAALAAEVEGGVAWAAVGVPATLRLWRGAAVYTAPRLGTWGSDITPFLPFGASVQIARSIAVRAEAELSWADFRYYNRRLHWGFAIAHQW